MSVAFTCTALNSSFTAYVCLLSVVLDAHSEDRLGPAIFLDVVSNWLTVRVHITLNINIHILICEFNDASLNIQVVVCAETMNKVNHMYQLYVH